MNTFAFTPKSELESYLKKPRYYEDPQACGTQKYNRLSLFPNNFVATDGIVELCDKHNCFWINDVIGSYLFPKLLNTNFLTCHFILNNDSSCDYIAHDGNYNFKIHQHIGHTDLTENLKLYCIFDGTHWVLMLPSEY